MKQGGLPRRTILTLLLTIAAAQGGADVLTYHNDNNRTGANLAETNLTPANVNRNTFGKLFSYALDGDVYTQPLYVSKLAIPGRSVHDVVFVATEHNSVYAFDADNNTGPSSGLLWQVNLGPSVMTPNPDFGNRYGGFTQITPEVGITGTPVIDLPTRTLYVDSFTVEGPNYIHRLHALNLGTGAERSFSPVIVAASIPGAGVGGSNGVVTFDAKQQLQRGALTLASGILYVPYAGYADTDPYHGWILGFNPATLKLSTNHIFNSTPNAAVADFGAEAGESGIWMGGSGLSVDAAGSLYFATGNGSFNAFNGSGGSEYGDSFLKLSTGRSLTVADYFTPYNQAYLADNDIDIGSGGVLLLPDQSGSTPHVMVGGGKDGTVYVINRDMFTVANNHFNTNGNSDAVLQTVALNGGNYDTPAYFNGMVYVTAANDVTTAFTVSNGMLSLPASARGPRTFPFPGATASISANGASDGIVWTIARWNPATLIAEAANDVSLEIYHSDQAGLRDQLPGGTKFAVPTIADGKVFVGGRAALSVFGLFTEAPFNVSTAGSYCGLFYGAAGAQVGQSGSVALTVNTKGGYVARLRVAAAASSFAGQFDGTGAAHKILNALGKPSVSVRLQLSATLPPQLTGTVAGSSWTAQITAYQTDFNARTNPAPYAGNYNVVMQGPNDDDPLTPQGDGYGTVHVTASGQLQFQGILADGTPVNQAATVCAGGQWPLYAALYGGRGQILGWVDFTNAAQFDLAGNPTWIKEPVPAGRSYPAGVDFAPVLQGSRSSAGSPVNFNAGILILNGPVASTNYFVVEPRQKFVFTNHVAFTFVTAGGRFSGSFPNPLGGRALGFNGIFLSKGNYGGGYFIDSLQSGVVYVGPLSRSPAPQIQN